ncbi:MAG: NUDIX domain-containing protein, partial [Bacteroidota bacterium]
MKRFNLRVYGILINDRDEVLVSDECRNGFSFTKFPGGGVEVGEGFPQALEREFEEELGIRVEVGELF